MKFISQKTNVDRGEKDLKQVKSNPIIISHAVTMMTQLTSNLKEEAEVVSEASPNLNNQREAVGIKEGAIETIL